MLFGVMRAVQFVCWDSSVGSGSIILKLRRNKANEIELRMAKVCSVVVRFN